MPALARPAYLPVESEGTVDAHHRAGDRRIPLEQVVRMFSAYRDGNGEWKDGYLFERVTW